MHSIIICGVQLLLFMLRYVCENALELAKKPTPRARKLNVDTASAAEDPSETLLWVSNKNFEIYNLPARGYNNIVR